MPWHGMENFTLVFGFERTPISLQLMALNDSHNNTARSNASEMLCVNSCIPTH
ncbi:hypothetical protein C5167_047421 [Papaver somniferum]|uniref:Uncharacterized protein n=1 Tax=Papaver somniferum TaxID=3469 RepID=A0A4Y7LGK7_PAPSO|nr:hypothetical protein C5167_047421 [Papaver somniferum]